VALNVIISRYEHEVYNEVEFEWIRPFYYHGQHHYDTQRWWHQPLQTLLGYLQRFEERCQKQHYLLLMSTKQKQKEGAEVTYKHDEDKHGNTASLSSKDLQRLTTVVPESYRVFFEALTVRNEKRCHWRDKYEDPINMSMPFGEQPLSDIPWVKPLVDVEEYLRSIQRANDTIL
jgi:hypothetical protein